MTFENMTRRIGTFFFNTTQRIEHFFSVTQRMNFFLQDSKNWTFFWTWLKDLQPFFHKKMTFKNWTSFLFSMTQRIELFFQRWLRELNFFLKWLEELNPFFILTQRIEYDSKDWTSIWLTGFVFFFLIWLKELNLFLEKMTQWIVLFFQKHDS